MKKYISLLIISLTIFSTPFVVLANGTHDITVEGVLTNIMESQNIADKSEIDCAKIADEQFEDMGEAVMSLMHPNEEEHGLMDKMMGGEGSESLTQAHIVMGQRYIGCSSDQVDGNMMGNYMNMMSSGGMMGIGFKSMMGGFGGSWLFNLFGLVIGIFFILGIAVFLKILLDRKTPPNA